MSIQRICYVAKCGRTVVDEHKTYIFCQVHWWNSLQERHRKAVALAWAEWAAGKISLHQRMLVEKEALEHANSDRRSF